jgi:hypothetical protein
VGEVSHKFWIGLSHWLHIWPDRIQRLSHFRSSAAGIATGLRVLFALIGAYSDPAWATPRCEVFFAPYVQSSSPPLLQRLAEYEGEERGEYTDPVTRAPWRVRYFTEAEREAYRVRLNAEGRFVDSAGRRMNSRFDEEFLSFEEALLVIDPQNRWFVLPFEERGRYHHSSLLAGGAVKFAGTVAFLDGQIRRLSDISGHYRPESWRMLWLLRDLQRRGANLAQIEVSGRGAREFGGSPHLRAHEVREMLLR